MDDDGFFSPLDTPDISGFDDLFATMFGAVQIGDVDGLKAIRSAEPEPFKEHLRMNGGLLLFEAVRMGLYNVGEFLLANGCSLRMCHGMTSSALHLAAYSLDAAEFLDRLAMYSSNCVDVQDIRYNTPLHVACACNNVRGVVTLLSHGAEVHKENVKRQCPLDLALSSGHVECVRLLLDRYENLHDVAPCDNVNLNDFVSVNSILNKFRTRSQMEIAAKSLFDVLGHENVAGALQLMHKWDRPRSNEILAGLKTLEINLSDVLRQSVECRLQCIDLLVQKQFKFNMLHLSLKYLSQEHYFRVVKSLVEDYGLDVNSMDTLHCTPLHIAVDRSDFEGVKYLLDSGAMVNGTWNIVGTTPLEMALQKRVMNEAIVRLLVERGAQINFIRSNGWCPLKGVLERHNEGLAQFLVDSGADVDLKNPATGFSIFMDFLLTTVSRQYNTTAMRFLLEHGATLENDQVDSTPLHFVASVLTSRDAGSVDLVKLLIKYSSDINTLDVEGNTPLLLAIKVPFHSAPIIRQLLESGADPKARNKSGQTALDLAITLRKVDVISLLMEHFVEYEPNVLFSNSTVLLDAVIINIPYIRDELFAMHAFLVRPDVTRERKSFVEKFINVTKDPNSDYLDDMSICLFELLRHSPVERSCLASMTSGSTVLFSQVEHHVLQMKLRGQVSESLLRGVLEYRIIVNEGDSYNAACDREIICIEKDFVPGKFLCLPERDQLLIISTQKGVRDALTEAVNCDLDGLPVVRDYPIFGVTLALLITGILAKSNLLSSAALFFNRHVSRIRQTNPHFKSLPQHIIDNILRYLAPSDLSNLIHLEENIIPKSTALLKKRWKVQLTHFLETSGSSTSKTCRSNGKLFRVTHC